MAKICGRCEDTFNEGPCTHTVCNDPWHYWPSLDEPCQCGQHPRFVPPAAAPLSMEGTTADTKAEDALTHPFILVGYRTAARLLEIHLGEFCDESLSMPDMIADASRKAAAALSSSRRALETLQAERDDAVEFRDAYKHMADMLLGAAGGRGEMRTLRADLARLDKQKMVRAAARSPSDQGETNG